MYWAGAAVLQLKHLSVGCQCRALVWGSIREQAWRVGAAMSGFCFLTPLAAKLKLVQPAAAAALCSHCICSALLPSGWRPELPAVHHIKARACLCSPNHQSVTVLMISCSPLHKRVVSCQVIEMRTRVPGGQGPLAARLALALACCGLLLEPAACPGCQQAASVALQLWPAASC